MKIRYLVIGALAALAATQALADDGVPQSAPPALMPYTSQPTIKSEDYIGVRPLRTQCYTNASDCSGQAYFNTDKNYKSCSVYFNNGANGQSNFVLPPNGNHSIYVRYGDTFACVLGNSGVPNGTQRYYIWVN